jgi:hypothetical protein
VPWHLAGVSDHCPKCGAVVTSPVPEEKEVEAPAPPMPVEVAAKPPEPETTRDAPVTAADFVEFNSPAPLEVVKTPLPEAEKSEPPAPLAGEPVYRKPAPAKLELPEVPQVQIPEDKDNDGRDELSPDVMSEPPQVQAPQIIERGIKPGGLLQHLFATVPSTYEEPVRPGLGEVLLEAAPPAGTPAFTRPNMPGLGVGLVHVDDSPTQERRMKKNRWFAIGIALFIIFDIFVVYVGWSYYNSIMKDDPPKVYKAIPIQMEGEVPAKEAPATTPDKTDPPVSTEAKPPLEAKTEPMLETRAMVDEKPAMPAVASLPQSEPAPAKVEEFFSPNEKLPQARPSSTNQSIESTVMNSADASLPVPPTPPLTAPIPPELPLTTAKLDMPLSNDLSLPLPVNSAMGTTTDTNTPSVETASSATQKITESKSPPQAAPSVKALKAFLSATTWTERLRWCQKPDVIRPLMQKYYQKHKEGPINVSRIDFLNHFPEKNGVPEYTMFEVTGPDFANPVLVLIDQPAKKNAQVDWETFTEFRDQILLKFLNNDSATPSKFRVMMHRKHYFDKDVPELDKLEGFEIFQPNTDYTGAVFSVKGSDVTKQILSQLQWGNDLAVILELAWKKRDDKHWVEIKSVPRYGWRG